MPPKRRRLPMDPNDTSDTDPQFGNVEDLPSGYKRQTSICVLTEVTEENAAAWSRLVIKFPECLGVEETLKNTAEKTKCIPTLNMDIPINLPVIRDCKVDLILPPPDYTSFLDVKDTKDGVALTKRPNNLSFILTGEDRLKKTAPSTLDETKNLDCKDVSQMAALSDAIWCKYWRVPNSQSVTNYTIPIKPTGWVDDYWLYGKSVGGIEGVNYGQVAQKLMRDNEGETATTNKTIFEQNNILPRGHLLLKDHVNLFVAVQQDGSTGTTPPLEFRVIVDYTIRQVSLSSLLVWQQQLHEFIPKQIKWRIYEQAKATKKNGWNILVSRGTIEESGTGPDPTDKTNFPDIDD